MRSFFKSKRFLVISAIALALAVIVLICGVSGTFSSPQSNFLSSVFKPIQYAASSISSSVSEFFDNMQSNEKMKEEMASLKDDGRKSREEEKQLKKLHAACQKFAKELDAIK